MAGMKTCKNYFCPLYHLTLSGKKDSQLGEFMAIRALRCHLSHFIPNNIHEDVQFVSNENA